MFKVFACTAIAVIATFSTVADRTANAQQAIYNYFSRTAESEAVLRSNETHHLNKGLENLRLGTPSTLTYARNEFDFILNYWPNHPRVLSLQAETLHRLRQGNEVDQYFERAYDMSPNVAQLHVTHGVALLRQNRVDDAIKRLQRGVELDENSLNGQYNLGLALVRAKRFEEANHHAQIAYALGHPLAGLKSQLQRANAWKPESPKSAALGPEKKQKKAQ